MKCFFTSVLLALSAGPLLAQLLPPIGPDTLLVENFLDTTNLFILPFPSGNDVLGVNYDADGKIALCEAEGPLSTPGNWFLESDLSFPDPQTAQNLTFQSCSYLIGGIRNANWLILPPVELADSSFWLCWKSAPYEGPGFMDGYRVVASTGSNHPADGGFTNLLFRAAENVTAPQFPSLDLDDFTFSPGYIHADGFTDTSYFWLTYSVTETNDTFYYYRGRLEPHCVSLAEFAGQPAVYLAFLHDSKNDNILQIDDILVSRENLVATHQPNAGVKRFRLLGNPASSFTYASWTLETPCATLLTLVDANGRLLWQKTFAPSLENVCQIDLTPWPAGAYFCTLRTTSGSTTQPLIKVR